MIEPSEIMQLAELIERADLLTLTHGDRRTALGRDIQSAIAMSLRVVNKAMPEIWRKFDMER